jgi:hypothetical protein
MKACETIHKPFLRPSRTRKQTETKRGRQKPAKGRPAFQGRPPGTRIIRSVQNRKASNRAGNPRGFRTTALPPTRPIAEIPTREPTPIRPTEIHATP